MAKVLTGPRGQGRLPPVPLFVNPEFQDHYDQVRQYNFESTLRAPPVPLFVNPEIESIPQTKESQPTDFQKSSPPIETPLQQAQPAPQQIARQPQFQQQIPVQRVTQPTPNTVPPQEWPGHFQPSGPNSEPPLYPWTPQPSQAPQGGARLAKPYQPPEQPPQDAYNKQRQQNWQGENDNQRPDYRKKVHQHQNHHHHHHGSHQIPHQHHHHHHQQLVQTQLQFPPQFHQHTQIQQIQHIAVPAQPIPVQQAVVVQPIQVQQPAVSQPQPQHNYRRPQDSSPPQTDGTPLDPGIAALLAVVPTAKIASGGPVENDYNDRDEEGEGRAVYCYNCGGTDHTVKNCKKPLFCTFCSKWGHTSNVCFKKKGDTAFNKTLDEVKAKAEGETPPPPREARFKGCFNCGGEDHTVKDCREKLYCTVCNKDGHTANKCKRCHNCGGHHMLKECQLPRQCKQCGSAKHTANVCTEIIKKPTEQTQDTPKEDEKPSEEPTQDKEPSPPQEHNTEAAAVVE